jgi:hypothetical protein
MGWPGAVLPYLLGAALVGWALWRCADRDGPSPTAVPSAAAEIRPSVGIPRSVPVTRSSP